MGQIAIEQQRLPLGCWIYVFDRSRYAERLNKPPSENLKASHYLARRLVSTQEMSPVNGIHPNVLAKLVGIPRIKKGLTTLNEGMFFAGKFYKTWSLMKDELLLDPSKHFVRLVPAENCRLPNFVKLPGLRDLVEPYGFSEEED